MGLPSYVGLATGAGAAGGLETLLARMRAEEQLSQHQQQIQQQGQSIQQQGDYQKGSLAIQQQGADRQDETARMNNEAQRVKLDMLRRIGGGDGSGGEGPNEGSGEGQGPGGGGTAGFNNPEGRTQFQIAGLNPNESFGAVPQPARPENLSPEESFYSSWAREHGLKDYHQIPSSEMSGLRKQWAQESHISNPSQSSEPMVQTDDPDNPGTSIWTPRSQAGGMRASVPGAQKDRLKAYTTTLDLIDAIEKQGDKVGWRGLGPVEGRIGSLAMEYLGKGDPEQESLRNMINTLKAQASFQEGGKQFTGTEKALLDNFLSGVNQNPTAARTRLQTFKEQARRSMSSLSGGITTPAPDSNPTAAPKKSGVKVLSITEVK